MFVLCVRMPGAALLEVMDSLRQNVSPPSPLQLTLQAAVVCFHASVHVLCSLQPAYGSAFAARTCGYLVLREGAGAGTLPRDKGQRLWCVLDGSTLLCYGDEEVSEG